MSAQPLLTGARHVEELRRVLDELDEDLATIEAWGRVLARVLAGGGRLLAVGNGGSAAQAQHLTAELVGRYRDDRRPYSALALHADTSTLTAVGNDYGIEEMFARQVRAHGRAGDVVLALSTSGRSPNVLASVREARGGGLTTWGLTGPLPNPLADGCDAFVAVASPYASTIQEAHLVMLHLLCAAFDCATGASVPSAPAEVAQ